MNSLKPSTTLRILSRMTGVISFGAILLWTLERYMEEGTLLGRIWTKGSGNNPPVMPSSLLTTVPATIPAAVKESPNTHNPSGLYPTSRIKPPDQVKCAKKQTLGSSWELRLNRNNFGFED
ncbi:hypothetical protein N7537_006066 [Penicillium hordei]|uniref:Uncharacterized protein n=1 Tax=Penicillium hordei TaxID=40994 RepID=A0AAD6E7G0_9EURO|nr:uncharacterized protein N7537_006066 [Penicillium hordei]KAJ5603110.1 hypothetical protein N7537_006066 [Penicillium hordei]